MADIVSILKALATEDAQEELKAVANDPIFHEVTERLVEQRDDYEQETLSLALNAVQISLALYRAEEKKLQAK